MADAFWKETGHISNDIDTADNWVGDVLPSANDDLYFLNGSVDVTGSLTLAANNVVIGENFTGKIGTSATSVSIDAGAFHITQGSTEIWLEHSGAADAELRIHKAQTTATPESEGVQLSTSGAGAFDPVHLNGAGNVNFEASVRIKNVYNHGVDLYIRATPTDFDNLTTFTTGTSTIYDEPSGTLKSSGGTTNIECTGTIADIDVDGGTVNLKQGADITDLEIFAGKFDATDVQGEARSTITNEVEVHGTGELAIDNEARMVTLTNGYKLNGSGATATPDRGSTVTLALPGV